MWCGTGHWGFLLLDLVVKCWNLETCPSNNLVMVFWLFKLDDPIGDKQEAEDTAILLGDLKYSTVLVCFMYDYDVAEMFCSFTSFQ
jgi:hypothetical protein